MTAHYDDPDFSYLTYWQNRDYENQSEIIAIDTLLSRQTFTRAVDIGGGYGRLIPTLKKYAKKIILIEPSAKQRRLAQKTLDSQKSVSVFAGSAEKTRLPDKSVPLVAMIRVMHHLPDPLPAFTEISRILKPNGVLVLEFANSKNFKSQIRSLLTGKPILPIPMEKRSLSNIKKNTIAFVNHHPITIIKLLKRVGLQVDKVLSVSNFRSSMIKRVFPRNALIHFERKLQPLLAGHYFGPSIFILARKSKKPGS